MLKRLLICTDLDRTLLPNGNQPESSGAREAFTRFVSRPEVILAYVSGRHRALVEVAIDEYHIPMPNWVIGDVGTTIYRIDKSKWLYCDDWEQAIAAEWRGFVAGDLRTLFADMPVLRLQEENKQNHYKLSYYLPMQTDVDRLQQEMTRRLNAQNLTAGLIYSVDEVKSVGLLDVLPSCATKLHAVEFLMQQQGFDCNNTVFAGDSGNDLPLLASGVPSVLVANADCGVAEQAQALARQNRTSGSLYLAQGGFLGMNGNYSAGILEGIAHYHPEARFWLEQDHELRHQ